MIFNTTFAQLYRLRNENVKAAQKALMRIRDLRREIEILSTNPYLKYNDHRIPGLQAEINELTKKAKHCYAVGEDAAAQINKAKDGTKLDLPVELKTPIIFNKKQNKSRIKYLEYINSDTGKARHFPPAAQE
jgi:hypothetical protein